NVYSKGVDFGIPVDSLDNEVSWYYEGRSAGQGPQGNTRYYTQVQDEVILNMLRNNQWLRPIYFANTVSPGSHMNLYPYFRFDEVGQRIDSQSHYRSGVLLNWNSTSSQSLR